MKLILLFTLLTLLATSVFAWEKEDHEIFDLVSAVEAAEGKGTTFYSWLDVPSTATTNEIAKAYRKLSMQIHPDKNPNDKKAHERFSRLGVISTILRNAESRKRYDFFYKNGVPKWRGTGYYYSRFRPGLGTVLVFLVLLTGGLQYLVQSMNYKNDLQRIERYVKNARLAAWGQKMVPVQGARKVKVSLGPQSFDEDGNAMGGGRSIDMVVEGDYVYILDPSGEMHLLDSSAATPATVSRIWFISLIRHMFRTYVKPLPNQEPVGNGTEDLDDDESSATASDVPGSGTVTPKEGIPAKVGGRRRKAPRKR